MKTMFKLFALTGLMVFSVQSKLVEYPEDTFAMQAPKDLTDLADAAADRIDFKGAYEIVVPKKAGLVGWNRFMGSVVNPQTQNLLVIINPAWVSQLPQEQQLFLIARCMMTNTQGITPWTVTVLPWLFTLISFSLAFFVYRLLRRTSLGAQSPVIRGVLVFGLLMAFNRFILTPLNLALSNYVIVRHEANVCNLVVEKTHDKESAIKALEFFDASMKQTVKNGETLFKQFENRFADVAQIVKK